MDSDLCPPSDAAGAKAAFHKPSNDPSSRKYRRRSPVSGSSSSDGDPVRERSPALTRRTDDMRDIDRDHHRSRYSRDGGSSRIADRRSYNDKRHDDYRKREKYAEEDQKSSYKLSPHTRGGSGSQGNRSDHYRKDYEQTRSRDYVDKHRDRSDGSGHRSSRDEHKRDDFRNEKRSGHHHKDSSWRDSKDLDNSKYTRFDKGRFYDQESRGLKDQQHKESRELLDDKNVLTAKKSKFSMHKDTEYTNDANEVQSSSLKQGQELAGKANTEQDFVKDSDIDAAKIAAMKAAESVNRNLIGTGFMSADQKKKLLWGSKKSTPIEEAARRWDTSTFSDTERQEKFKKLMSLRLVWPIVGCERGAKTRGPRQQSCREAKRAPAGLGETVHCWSSSKGWSYCRARPLITISVRYFYVLYLLCSRYTFLIYHVLEQCSTFKLYSNVNNSFMRN